MLTSAMLFLACTWVTQADKDALVPLLDNDNDGFRNGDDCAPDDAAINKGAEEILYNCKDENCDGQSDLDVDGDGHGNGAAYDFTPGTCDWEADLESSEDCCDENARISTAQPDTFYDGIDQNCDGADDYDQDGDGHALGDAAQVVDPVMPGPYCEVQVDYTGGDDCNDQDAAINPGATEIWYDGIDQNCDGANDNDQDGDGFISALDAGGDDCDDTDPNILPTATEIWYDGIDQNCDGADDYDQDGDGYTVDTQVGGLDCNDTNAGINPSVVEILSDVVDDDCDGALQGFGMIGFSSLGWSFTNPITTEFGTTGSYVYLSINAETSNVIDDSVSTQYFDGAFAVRWLPNSIALETIDGLQQWAAATGNTNREVEVGHRMVQNNAGNNIFNVVASSQPNGSNVFPRLSVYDSAMGAERSRQYSTAIPVFEDLAAAVDDSGTLHVFACQSDDGRLEYNQFPLTNTNANYEIQNMPASTCAADTYGSNQHLLLGEATGVVEYDFVWGGTVLTLQPTGQSWEYLPRAMDIPAGLSGRAIVLSDATTDDVVVIDDAGVVPISTTITPYAVALREDSTGVRTVAYTGTNGQGAWEARLAHESNFGYVAYTITLPTGFVAADIALWVDGGSVYVAIPGSYTSDGSYDVLFGHAVF